MLLRKPDYYDRFQCAMGACKDTCCAAWDIVIDEEHAAFYRDLPGKLGDCIRAAMRMDEEGDLCFSVEGGHCPLLTGDGLCSIQLELGEDKVCDTCRSHPRFIEEYGSWKEMALAASCPAAIQLILAADASLETETDEEAEFVCEDVDEELLRALLPCRERAFALLKQNEWTWKERLSALLRFGVQVQLALCSEGADSLPRLAEQWEPPDAGQWNQLEPDVETVRATRMRCVELLGELEPLDPRWKADVTAAMERKRLPQSAACGACQEDLERRWVEYLLWRWFLRADFDGDVYGKLALPVWCILSLRELSCAEDWEEWARRWAKEVEHSAENRNAVYDALCSEESLAPQRLINAL